MAEEAAKKAPAAEPKEGAERATNCASCNKRLVRKKQYYRNGAYFCNKRCWNTATDKAADAEAKAQAEAKTQAASKTQAESKA